MNRLKKLTSLLLALVMVFAMTATAFADGEVETTVAPATITITGGAEGSVYAAYKLLNATNAGNLYAYTLNDTYTAILQNVTGKTEQAEIVKYIEALDADGIRAFADAVYADIEAADPAIAADYTTSDNSFDDVDQGYYLIVETKVGNTADTFSLVMLDTKGEAKIEVATKEDAPSVEKKVEEKNDSTDASSWGDSADYDIGDSINYKITGTVSSKYADYKSYYYSFGDTMDAGLTYNDDAKVYVVNGEVKTDVTAQFAIVEMTEGNGFTATSNLKELVLPEGVSISASTTIVVEYSATLNENAVSGTAGNENKVVLEYENNPYHEGDGTPNTPDKPEEPGKTPEDVNIVFTFDAIVNKVDKEGNALAGAGFTLYKWEKESNDWVAVSKEIFIAELKEGKATFEWKGLDVGEYKLVETTVPAGYNKCDDIVFEVVAKYDTAKDPYELTGLQVQDADGTVISEGEKAAFTTTLAYGKIETNVVNLSGTELPSTGGMGTTMLYVVGGLLVVGAVVVMISKKKAEEK